MSEPVDTDKVREWGICDCENLCDEVDDLRARLAEVEAKCEKALTTPGYNAHLPTFARLVRAAAREKRTDG